MGLYEFILFLYVSLVQRNARIALADTADRVRESSNFLIEYVAIHVKAFHLLTVLLLHVCNVFLYVYRFPVFGTFMFLAEAALLLYLVYESPAKAALRGLYNAVFSFISFGYMTLQTHASDRRIEELQSTVSKLMEENHKLLDQMAELQHDLLRARESEFTLFSDLASHLGGASSKIQLMLLAGLSLVLVTLAVGKTVRRFTVSRREEDDCLCITLESHMPGSKLSPCASPAGVVKVVDGENDMPLGTASLINLPESPNSIFIITAKHVVEVADKVKIGLTSGQWFGLPRDYIDLGRDMAAYEVKKVDFLKIARHGDKSFGKGDLLKLHNKTATGPVTIYSDGRMSTGVVTPLPDSFAVLTYSGSTEKGFSGAPYLSGKTVMGIHTSGTSAYNMGVEAAYVRARLLRYLDTSRIVGDVNIESSDTVSWLVEEVTKQLHNNKHVKWDRLGDDFDVRVQGKYFTVDEDTAIDMGLIKGSKANVLSYADMGDFSDNDPRMTRESYDTNPMYNDSENSKRGSAVVQAPGAKKEQVSAQGPSSTTSPDEKMSANFPQELTFQNMLLLQSTIAQLVSLLQPMQGSKTAAAPQPSPTPVVTTGKGMRQKKGQQAPKETPQEPRPSTSKGGSA